MAVGPSEAIEIPLAISRSPKLNGDTRLELVASEESGWRAEPVTLGPDETKASLRVIPNRIAAGGERRLTIRATVRPAPHLPVISQTDVILLAPPAAGTR